ncbi:MAG: rod shape-determining protein MreC [Acidimicrobiia bacterium]
MTLLVIGLLLMTFDVRSEGGGVTGVLRSGTQTIVAPLQKATAFVVNPVVDLIDSLSSVATLRETNLELQRQLAEAEAALIAFEDDRARLALYEELLDLESTGIGVGTTPANVIGQPNAFDNALYIDKGTSSGIAVGQPVIDTSGFVVGSIQQVTEGTAIVVPITAGSNAVTVLVGEQIGAVTPQVATDEMRLDINPARAPVLAGDKVVTSSTSVRFPAGYPVGEVTADAAPSVDDALTTTVRPFADPDTLRVVVVLAWPPDPIAAITVTTTTTTTTTPGSTTTTTAGDG